MPSYRYENKYVINKYIYESLRRDLSLVMKLDPHSISKDISYNISSLYYDDIDDSAYIEKVDGVEYRKKYRIRIYNGDIDTCKLECKYKDENMTYKQDCKLNKKNLEYLLKGEFNKIKFKDELLSKFIIDSKLYKLKPSVIVDYARLAYIYPYSEVRITFDSLIKSGKYDDFINRDIVRVDCLESDQIVLEVKYNEMLPEHIQTILNQYNLTLGSLSKFALCEEFK